MKNKNLFIVGLLIAAVIAIGGLAYFQGAGNMYQGALLPRTTTYSISTPTLESLNEEVKALKAQVETLNNQVKINAYGACLNADLRDLMSTSNAEACANKLLDWGASM